MRGVRLIVGSCLTLLGLLLLAYGIYLALTPNVYQSTIRIKVEKDLTELTNPQYSQPGFDPYWVQNEFEKIQSKVILFPVITNLNLHQTWAGKLKKGELSAAEVYPMLKQKLEVSQTRGTSLIEITFKSNDPNEAARIANAVADEYRQYRLASNRELMARGMKTYEKELEKQNQEILALEARIGQTGESLNTNSVWRELETMRAMRERLKARFSQETVAFNKPTPQVEIIDPAEPAMKPIFPNRGAMVLAILLGIGMSAAGMLILRARIG